MLEALTRLICVRTRRDENGATATEYAILVGFMVFAMILGLSLFGTALSDRFGVMGTVVGTFDDHF